MIFSPRGSAGVATLTSAAGHLSPAFLPSRPKLLQKNSLQRKCFEAMNPVKITKQSLYKTDSLACFLTKSDTPVAATLQRKYFGGILFVITTKKDYKSNCSKELFCNIFGQDFYFVFPGLRCCFWLPCLGTNFEICPKVAKALAIYTISTPPPSKSSHDPPPP